MTEELDFEAENVHFGQLSVIVSISWRRVSARNHGKECTCNVYIAYYTKCQMGHKKFIFTTFVPHDVTIVLYRIINNYFQGLMCLN